MCTLLCLGSGLSTTIYLGVILLWHFLYLNLKYDNFKNKKFYLSEYSASVSIPHRYHLFLYFRKFSNSFLNLNMISKALTLQEMCHRWERVKVRTVGWMWQQFDSMKLLKFFLRYSCSMRRIILSCWRKIHFCLTKVEWRITRAPWILSSWLIKSQHL